MQLKAGARLKSSVCDGQVVVVRPPSQDVALTCGGAPMVGVNDAPAAAAPLSAAEPNAAVIGKRYVDETSGLEVLCNKGSKGALAVDSRVLAVKEAKQLPSSD
jgi:hypothetical protein